MAKSYIDGNDCNHLLNVPGDNDGYISFAFLIVNSVAEAISSTIAFHLQYIDEDVLLTSSLNRSIPDIPIENLTWPLKG